MRLPRLSLGMKFAMAVTTLIVITMAGVATLIIDYQEDALQQSTSDGNLAMTRNLAHDAESPLLVFDPLRLNDLVETIREATACSYAMILDREGTIVAHTERSRLGGHARSSFGHLISALIDGQESITEQPSDAGPLREYAVPVKIGGESVGLAVIAYSVRTVNEAIELRLQSLRRYLYLISGLIILAGIVGAFGVATLLTRPLKRLKDRMLDVQAGDLNAEVENPGVVRCWERLTCGRKDCPARGRERCWAVAGTFCHGAVQGTFAQKIGDCRKCVVYRESCGDEIKELVEVFNQMVKDLRHNLSELQKASLEKARLERLSALGEMATTVAHETKNPLNAIRLATAYLKSNFQGDLLHEFLGIIEDEVSRLNELTSEFLGFSRPAPLRLKNSDINAIVRAAVDLIRQEATDRNIEVVLLTDEHVPPVACDPSQMKQALLNLLINAMDASSGGDAITVTTTLSSGRLEISVEDTGAGIAAEEVDNIFKPFYTTKTRGSGLGLAIVDRIVKEHQGAISVKSTEGKGTSFTITLQVNRYAGTEYSRN